MSSISKLTLSLSLLTLIPLHAMEEDNSYGKKNNLKGSGEYGTLTLHPDIIKQRTEAFRKEATNLILAQTFHVLETGDIPEYATQKELTPGNHGRPLPVKFVVDSTDKARGILVTRIEAYFSDKKSESRENEDEDILYSTLSNATKICKGEPQIKSSEYRVSNNLFSYLVLVENRKYFLAKQEYSKAVGYQEADNFNACLVSAIQHRIADYSIHKLIDDNDSLKRKIDEGKNDMKEIYQDYLQEKNKVEKWKFLAGAGAVGGTAFGAGAVYIAAKNGYININK